MSAMPPTATKLTRHNKLSRCATSGHTDGASGSAPGDDADHRIATKLADFQKEISCDQLIHSADDSHGQRFHAAAHGHLAHRKPAHFGAGSGGDDVGHNELTTIIFGHLFKGAGKINQIPDSGQEEVIPEAKLTQH